jgi:hypothetical protein
MIEALKSDEIANTKFFLAMNSSLMEANWIEICVDSRP